MRTAPIFRNNAGTKQCARREDGQWFIRYRRIGRPGWTRWEPATFVTRPTWSWYDPNAGRARLSPVRITRAANSEVET